MLDADDSCLQSYLLGRLRQGGLQFEASLGKNFTKFHLQNNQSKMESRCVAQVVDDLLCQHEALRANYNPIKILIITIIIIKQPMHKGLVE
jgi:hypothetical protein